jgi:hypothetical protein
LQGLGAGFSSRNGQHGSSRQPFLIQFLQRNGPNLATVTTNRHGVGTRWTGVWTENRHRNVHQWTADQLRDVVRAIKWNTSVHHRCVRLESQTSEEIADKISGLDSILPSLLASGRPN